MTEHIERNTMDFFEKDFAKLDRKQRMKLIKGSIIPRPIAWITTKNADESINLAPFSYFNMLSSTLVGVSFVRGEAGRQKDTLRNLLREKEAVINIPDLSLIAQVDQSSEPLPENESEVSLTGLTLTGSRSVSTPGIKEAKIRLETVLEQHLPLLEMDGNETEADLVLLRIRYAHIRQDVFDEEKEYILHEKLDPLARLGGPYYAVSRAVEGFTRKS